MVFRPIFTASRAMRVDCERAEARMPRSALRTGGFQTHEVLAPLRRARVGDRAHRTAEQPLGQLARIADRRRARDEHRVRLVERADPPQPPDEVRDVRSEHAAVGVQLVDHDELQRLEELRPLGVMRQDRLVQHVGVRHDDVAVRPHRLPRVARRVAVEGVGSDAEPAGRIQLEDLADLVLRERFGREEVERFRAARQRRVDDRQVVAKRLAGRGRGDDHRVATRRDVRPGFVLMAIEVPDAARFERGAEPRIEVVGEFRYACGTLRGDDFADDPGAVLAFERFDQGLGGVRLRSQAPARVRRRFIAEEILCAFEERPHRAPRDRLREACGRCRLTT